jgi:hypothetical protein
MNHSKVPIDNSQWKRIGRRRFTMLAILLAINLSLVVLGVNSQVDRASIAMERQPPHHSPGRPLRALPAG